MTVEHDHAAPAAEDGRSTRSPSRARTPVMRRALDALHARLPNRPAHVAMLRAEMTRHVIVHTCAEHERALADGEDPTPGWDEIGELLLDGLVGLHTAPAR